MRLPWTIWRQTFFELWRLLLLTAGVLVVVVSFAVSVRLTAQGKLGPLDTLRYMFFIMPPMLQFTLPFAAAFGATLTYHRMSQDNELTAAAASGVSHRVLLMPALASGVALAVIVGLLLDEVAPRSFRKIEEMMAGDVARLVMGPIEQGQPLILGGTLVHADRVVQLPPNDDGGDSLLLSGVAVLDMDPAGRVLREAWAGQAVADFSPMGEGEDTRTRVAVRLVNAAVFSAEDGVVPRGDSLTMYATLPSTFDDNPKFRTTRDLRELPGNLDRLRFVDVARRDLAYHMAERDAVAAIAASLKSKGVTRLKDEAGRTLTVRAAGLKRGRDRWDLTPAKGGVIEVDLSSADGAGTVKLSAASGGLRSYLGKDRESRTLTFKLELERVAGRLRASDAAGERESEYFGRLSPLDSPLEALLKLPTPQLLEEADRRAAAKGADPDVNRPAEDLRKLVKSVGREIVSKYHERWASTVAAMLMVLTGALTAMRLGSSLPLAVYLWCFFPALFTVVTIAMGQQVAHKVGLAGLGVLWAAVIALAVYAGGAFLVVRRH